MFYLSRQPGPYGRLPGFFVGSRGFVKLDTFPGSLYYQA